MTDRIEYSFGGALIRSALPLPELTIARDSDRKTPVIEVLRSENPLHGECVYRWAPQTGVFLERAPDGWVYRFPAQQLAIGVDPSGETMRIDSAPEHSDLAGEFLVRRVLPRVMDLHGRLLMHGATVAIDKGDGLEAGAIALIGRSRAGKSTLASALCRSGGFQLMGDDSTMLERDDTGWSAYCSSRTASLRQDSAAVFGNGREGPAVGSPDDKMSHVTSGKPVSGPRRLLGIYVLERGPDVRIEPLSKYDAVWHAVQNAVRFNPGDWAAEGVRLPRIHALAQEVPAVRLSYPRVYARLDDVCDALRRDLA